MESAGILPTVLTAIGVVAGVLLGVWQIVARYDNRLRGRIDTQSKDLQDRIDTQSKDLQDRIDVQGKETAEQLGQLRERMAKLEGLLEGLREAITGKRAA